MALQVIRMQLDEAGDQRIAFEIMPLLRRPSFTDLRDHAIGHRDPATMYAIRHHDVRVLDDEAWLCLAHVTLSRSAWRSGISP
jgi:hypothetical protein